MFTGTGTDLSPTQFHNVTFDGESTINLDGQDIDVGSQEGVAQLVGRLGGLQELHQLMGLLHLRMEDGRLIPDDSYGGAWGTEGPSGPADSTAGQDALTRMIGNDVFTVRGYPSPYHAESTPELEGRVQGQAGYQNSVAAARAWAADPDNAALRASFVKTTNGYLGTSSDNPFELLFLVMREALQETNEDKKYKIQELKDLNTIGKALADYLKELHTNMQDLSEQIRKKDEDTDVQKIQTSRPVQFQDTDISTVGPSGEALTGNTKRKHMNQGEMDNEIKKVEQDQETLRNTRQKVTTQFQSIDQKANQLMNMLSSVLKTKKELEMAPTRNLLS
jgi:hypothetical protein